MRDQKELDSHLNLFARPELLEIVSSISDLKNIKENYIFSMLEEVLTKTAITKYGSRYNIRVKIYRSNGAIVTEKVVTVVEEVDNPDHQISVEEAQKINANYVIGDEIIEELPPIDFTRGMMQKSLGILNRSIKDYEKKREYDLYKSSVGELVSGIVKRNEFGSIVIDLGNNAEGFLPREQSVKNEKINVGDRIRAIIIQVKDNPKGPQIILSRNHPDFIVKLFFQEIPEVFDGVVTIKAIARDPGFRTKIIVDSSNPAIDPVGISIGFKGAKIQGILQELKGEKIDLIKYSEHFLNLVVNAFWPIEILKVIVDEEKETLNIVVDSSQLSIVIGRGGQNIRLVSRLLKWNIEVMTEEEERDKRQKSIQEKLSSLMNALDVDEVVAHLLILEGYSSIEALSKADIESLVKIEDFTEDLAEELILRAKSYIEQQEQELSQELYSLNLEPSLLNFNHLSLKHKLILGKDNVKSLQDLADLSSFELADILKDDNFPMKKIESIIMAARDTVMESDLKHERK